MLRKIFGFRLRLSLSACFWIIIAASAVVCLLMLQLQPIGFLNVIANIRNSNGIVFIMNFLPILAFMVLLFFLCQNLVISVYSVSFVGIALSLINRYKLIFRRSPFLPWDVMLGGEALEISKSFNFSVFSLSILFLLIIIALFIFSYRMIIHQKLRVKYRVFGFVATFAMIYLLNTTIFTNNSIYNNIFVDGNIYNQEDQFNSKGFLYSFIYNFNNSRIEMPINYDKQEFMGISASNSNIPAVKPNVFVILGEAFSEIPLNPGLDFSGYDDPLVNYKSLLKESIHGTLIAPGFGGGTADTEFDILTGISTRDFRGVPYTFMLVTKPFESLISVLNNIGYDNVAIHPGQQWFYNRQNVYRYFGFSNFIHEGDFNPSDKKREYMSEQATFDRLIGEYENHIKSSPSTPFFAYCVTIQNHGPYTDKYEATQNFKTSLPFNKQDLSDLSNYFVGLKDADTQLGRLTDYLKHQSQPVILLYYGDHKPFLSQSVYDILNNEDEKLTAMYKAPFIIWQNDAAKASLNINIEKDMVISDFYLGATLLEALSLEKLDPFFEYLCQLKKEHPVIMEKNWIDKENTVHDSFSEEIEYYKRWGYFRLFDK